MFTTDKYGQTSFNKEASIQYATRLVRLAMIVLCSIILLGMAVAVFTLVYIIVSLITLPFIAGGALVYVLGLAVF